jgi:hypothetical protein
MDNAGHRWESTSALYFCAITTAVALALSPLPSRADLPEFATYQIPMGNPAANVQEALSTLPNRIREVINWNA